jgi:uncharacterized protein (DUF2252 family)
LARAGRNRVEAEMIDTERRPVVRAKRPPAAHLPSNPKLLTRAEAYAVGKGLRGKCPRDAHAAWRPPQGRPDAVQLVLAAEKGRIGDLLPLRHGRMSRSPFTFFRGAALTMATDLASTRNSGLRVQCCGDAHLSNFGGFATPERRVIFSINDLDETLPAPWEWDVKRLAASFVVACRDNALSDACARVTATLCVRTYRQAMAEFGELETLELWYQALDVDELVAGIKDPAIRRRAVKRLQKERAKSIAHDIFPKLAEQKGTQPLIKDQLPSIFHHADVPPGVIATAVTEMLAGYRDTLTADTQSLLDHYVLCDAAIKVVGIGSVGTLCWVLLYMAREGDPLFLQVKEARASVLEPFAGGSAFANHGQRVVDGCRRMQPASDMFLGWGRGPKRDYFIRQLRDIKISLRVESFGRAEMELYATWCGRALALSHARSGAAMQLSGYMGRSDVFDEAIARFALAYADQNEKDHAAFRRAIQAGKVEASVEEEER